MPEHDIMLIQGPPGTGKTHTITGIISMLLSSGVNKIHVCAPSNAAVDEILARLSVNGIHGVSNCEDDLKRILLRIGAMEYEPAPAVKIHTLDERLRETLHDARVYELREKINCGEELLDVLKTGKTLDSENNRHLEFVKKTVIGENIKKAK